MSSRGGKEESVNSDELRQTIRSTIEKLNISQKYLSQQIGVVESTLSRRLGGSMPIYAKDVMAIADVVRCNNDNEGADKIIEQYMSAKRPKTYDVTKQANRFTQIERRLDEIRALACIDKDRAEETLSSTLPALEAALDPGAIDRAFELAEGLWGQLHETPQLDVQLADRLRAVLQLSSARLSLHARAQRLRKACESLNIEVPQSEIEAWCRTAESAVPLRQDLSGFDDPNTLPGTYHGWEIIGTM